MTHILITSGPTRQYLDPVRYLTNCSSGRMGKELCAAALRLGHQVTVVTGPVCLTYPSAATVIPVVTTKEMMDTCLQLFPTCDGVIGAAAPADYQPQEVLQQKMSKTGTPRVLELIETDDVIATLGRQKRQQWVVGFALETDDHHFRAMSKLEQKCCDAIVLNQPSAMDSPDNNVQVMDPTGSVIAEAVGPKSQVADVILDVIQKRLIQSDLAHSPRSSSHVDS